MSINLFSFRSASEVLGKSLADFLDLDDIESLKEICRICDKKKEVECPRCFVFHQLHQRNASGDVTHVTSHIHNNPVIVVEDVTPNSEGNGPDGQNQSSKKFFSEALPSPLGGCYPEGVSYINVTHHNVTPEKHKSALDGGNEGNGKSSDNQIKTFENGRVTSTCVSDTSKVVPYKATKQDTLTIYTLLEDLDETDCWIIHYLQQGKHQAEVARILNLSRKTISVRVKKLVESKLVIPLTLKPIRYRLNDALVKAVRSRIFGIKKNDKNGLGGDEAKVSQQSPPSPLEKPARCLLDVHHIGIKFQYRVKDVTSDSAGVSSFGSDPSINLPHPHQPRLACHSCPKFQEKFKHPGRCKCKRGRFAKMNNWVFFAVKFNGYEISSNPSTLVVKGIRIPGTLKPNSAVAEAVLKAEKILSEYFSRWMEQTGIIVDIYWDLWDYAGKPHWAINHPISQEIQHEVGGTLRANLGDDDYLQVDSSPDEDGVPQNHIEYVGTKLEKVDRFAKLLNGEYDHKLSSIEQTISKLATVAAGGYSTQTIADIIKSGMRSLESRISRIENEFESLKTLVTSMREELQQLILEGNGKHIREINTALQTMAALWLRMDSLESKLQEFRSVFGDVPDPGGGPP